MQFTRLISSLSCLFAIIFNFLLIFIIIKKSSQRLGKYKYFLLAYALNACYFSLSQISTLPTWYIPANGFFFYSSVTIFPRSVQQILMTCFNSSYMFNMIILGWCFLYRLAVIQNAHPWILLPRNFRLMSLFSIILATYIVGICDLVYPTASADQLFRDGFQAATQLELADVAYIGGELTIDGNLNIPLCVAFSSYLIFLNVSSCILAVCWFKIGNKLQGIRNVSSANYRFQKKLFVLLTLQTGLPIVFNFIPGGIIMILGITNVHSEHVVLMCSMVLSFAQLCDPIFTVILVVDYKKAVLKILNKTFGCGSLPASTYNSVVPVRGTAGSNKAS